MTNYSYIKSIVVASKLTSDVFYSNKRYAKVIKTIDSLLKKGLIHVIDWWIIVVWNESIGIKVFIFMQFWFTCQVGKDASLWKSAIISRFNTAYFITLITSTRGFQKKKYKSRFCCEKKEGLYHCSLFDSYLMLIPPPFFFIYQINMKFTHLLFLFVKVWFSPSFLLQ